jgi:hypothetical protein
VASVTAKPAIFSMSAFLGQLLIHTPFLPSHPLQKEKRAMILGRDENWPQ